jgi:hypothetical protein
MKLSVEELVNIVVAAVVAELAKRGIEVEFGPAKGKTVSPVSVPNASVHVINMAGYRSPVLLESHLQALPTDVKEIAVPERTVVTPGAREIIKRKNLILKSIPKTN